MAYRLTRRSPQKSVASIVISYCLQDASQRHGISYKYDRVKLWCGPRNTTITIAGKKPEIVMARFDLDDLRAYWLETPSGGVFGRPKLHARITNAVAVAPFLRMNAKRALWDA